METQHAVVETDDEGLGYEYLQCHATVENHTGHRLTVNNIDPRVDS